MNSNVFGIDIAKQVFQIHRVDQETGEIHSDKVKRKDFVQYFANQQPSMIGMEACGGAHHWGRLFIKGQEKHSLTIVIERMSQSMC